MTAKKRDDQAEIFVERKGLSDLLLGLLPADGEQPPLLWSGLCQQTGLPTDSIKRDWSVGGEKDGPIPDEMVAKPEEEL
jgi:hypothetical protein